jgi:hypothetical protein
MKAKWLLDVSQGFFGAGSFPLYEITEGQVSLLHTGMYKR